MTKTIDIFGQFIDSECEREDSNDITPNAFKEQIAELASGDELEIHMNSCGGNCTSGIAIANMIRQLNANGVQTRCVVDGICASIATVCAMACKELVMYPQSFLMIHNPWTCVQGDADTLRKEAVSLDAMRKAILSFYREKFDLTDEELQTYMDAETWISGSEKDTYRLNATILENPGQFKIAAKMLDEIKSRFNNRKIIEGILDMTNEEKEVKPVEETEEQKVEQAVQEPAEQPAEQAEPKKAPEETVAEEVTEAQPEGPSVEELVKENEQLKAEIEELRKQLEEPVDKRVSGMQAKMQLRINDLTKDFTDKIQDFKNQLEKKTQELDELQKQSIGLKDSLVKAEGELRECVSALEVKNQALAELNAGVNTPKDAGKDSWKNLHGKDFFDWVEKHPKGI